MDIFQTNPYADLFKRLTGQGGPQQGPWATGAWHLPQGNHFGWGGGTLPPGLQQRFDAMQAQWQQHQPQGGGWQDWAQAHPYNTHFGPGLQGVPPGAPPPMVQPPPGATAGPMPPARPVTGNAPFGAWHPAGS